MTKQTMNSTYYTLIRPLLVPAQAKVETSPVFYTVTYGVNREVNVPMNRLRASAEVSPLFPMNMASSGPSDIRTSAPLTLRNVKETMTSISRMADPTGYSRQVTTGSVTVMSAIRTDYSMAPCCLTPPTRTLAGMEKTRN